MNSGDIEGLYGRDINMCEYIPSCIYINIFVYIYICYHISICIYIYVHRVGLRIEHLGLSVSEFSAWGSERCA